MQFTSKNETNKQINRNVLEYCKDKVFQAVEIFNKINFKYGEAVCYELLCDILRLLEEPLMKEMQTYLSLIQQVQEIPKGFTNYFHLTLHPVFSVQLEAHIVKKLEMLKLQRKNTKGGDQLELFYEVAKNKYFLEKFNKKENEMLAEMDSMIAGVSIGLKKGFGKLVIN